MIPASITLHSASNRLTARIGGMVLTSSFRQHSGNTIPPGNYTLSPPMHNSVYGTFALLSPTREASPWAKDWVDPYHPVAAKVAGKDWIDLRQTAGWIDLRQSGGWIDLPSLVNQPGVFVLLEQPLAGRNTVLITASFAELMAALERAGGATVAVA